MDFKLKNRRLHTNGLCYFTHGSAVIMINGVNHTIKPGTIILLDANLSIEVSATIANEVHFYFLQYKIMPMSKLEHTKESKIISFQVTSEARIISLLDEIKRVVSDDLYITWLKRQAFLYELLYVIFKDKAYLDMNKNRAMKQTIDYMNKHYIEDLTIRDLARLAFMTPSSFCRAFKRETGLTPSGYLRNLRMEKAKKMLKTSAYSVKDVALTVGFADELYFSRLFKNAEGIPPTIYRKKNEPTVAIMGNLFLQDHVLSLGIQPIAAPCFPTQYPTKTGFPSYLEKQLQGTKKLNAEMPFNLKEVLEMTPHFLLKQNENENNERKIDSDTKIIQLDKFLHWKDYQRYIAQVVGREELAETVIQNTDKVEQMAKDKLKEITKKGKWTIIRVLQDSLIIHGVTGHPINDLFYHGLGFQWDDRLNYSSCKNYSLHELFALNPERLIILWSDKKALDDLSKNPLWLQLQAVKNNHIYLPNSFAWDPWGPSGRSYIVKECVKHFLAY